jgi:hypothetical protein
MGKLAKVAVTAFAIFRVEWCAIADDGPPVFEPGPLLLAADDCRDGEDALFPRAGAFIAKSQ